MPDIVISVTMICGCACRGQQRLAAVTQELMLDALVATLKR